MSRKTSAGASITAIEKRKAHRIGAVIGEQRL
jgi:hypothetical protein